MISNNRRTQEVDIVKVEHDSLPLKLPTLKIVFRLIL